MEINARQTAGYPRANLKKLSLACRAKCRICVRRITRKPTSCWNKSGISVLNCLAAKVKNFKVALRRFRCSICRNPPRKMSRMKRSTSLPHDRRKRGRKPLPEELPRVEVVHDIDDADKTCACGCQLTPDRRRGFRATGYHSPQRCRSSAISDPSMPAKTVKVRKMMGRRSKSLRFLRASSPDPLQLPGLLAHILTAKFVDHTPFYRQEKQFQRLGVDISRTSMCSWAMQVASSSQPLLNLFIDEVLSSFVIQADETTLQVLQEPGRDPTTKSYMWIFRRGRPWKSGFDLSVPSDPRR